MSIITLGLIFLFILVAGALRSTEVGCQNTMKSILKNAWLCAAVSFGVALTGFLIFLAVSTVLSSTVYWPDHTDLQHMPWWAPLGELIGAVSVVSMITVSKHVGVATFGALLIVSEMLVALIMDNFGLMGFVERQATTPRIAAAGLITLAVYLMAKDSHAEQTCHSAKRTVPASGGNPSIPAPTNDAIEPLGPR